MTKYFFASAQYNTPASTRFVNMTGESEGMPSMAELEEFFRKQESGEIVGKVIIMGLTILTKKEYYAFIKEENK